MTRFNGAYPISGEDLSALPVKVVSPAVEFYKTVLGFSVVSSDDETAYLERGAARIGLVSRPDHKPGEAGSFAIGVDDIDGMHAELAWHGLDLGGIRNDFWDGKPYRVFFLREAENGYCFCFCQRV
jgi:lactoylglutathione lyase